MHPADSRLDVLAFAAHPDDVELSAGGTVCTLTQQGYRVGVVDLTRGELGSRGTPELRDQEAAHAAAVMKLSMRENIGLPDGQIDNSHQNQLKLIRVIRRHRPHIVLIGALECRHPDHGAATRLCIDALFYAGLRKVETRFDGDPQEPWRPHHVLHYMQTIDFEPTFVVDVSDVWEQRIEALRAFKSQFYNPEYQAGSDEPETFVSNAGFFSWVEARARAYGYRIGATYGEPLLYRHGPVGVRNLPQVLNIEKPFR